MRQKNVSLRFSNRRLSLPFISKANSVKYVVFESLYKHSLCAMASDEGKGITVHDHIKGNEQLLHFPTKNEIKGIAFIKGPSLKELALCYLEKLTSVNKGNDADGDGEVGNIVGCLTIAKLDISSHDNFPKKLPRSKWLTVWLKFSPLS